MLSCLWDFKDYDSLDADDELGGVCLHLKEYVKDLQTGKETNY